MNSWMNFMVQVVEYMSCLFLDLDLIPVIEWTHSTARMTLILLSALSLWVWLQRNEILNYKKLSHCIFLIGCTVINDRHLLKVYFLFMIEKILRDWKIYLSQFFTQMTENFRKPVLLFTLVLVLGNNWRLVFAMFAILKYFLKS